MPERPSSSVECAERSVFVSGSYARDLGPLATFHPTSPLRFRPNPRTNDESAEAASLISEGNQKLLRRLLSLSPLVEDSHTNAGIASNAASISSLDTSLASPSSSLGSAACRGRPLHTRTGSCTHWSLDGYGGEDDAAAGGGGMLIPSQSSGVHQESPVRGTAERMPLPTRPLPSPSVEKDYPPPHPHHHPPPHHPHSYPYHMECAGGPPGNSSDFYGGGVDPAAAFNDQRYSMSIHRVMAASQPPSEHVGEMDEIPLCATSLLQRPPLRRSQASVATMPSRNHDMLQLSSLDSAVQQNQQPQHHHPASAIPVIRASASSSSPLGRQLSLLSISPFSRSDDDDDDDDSDAKSDATFIDHGFDD